MAAERALRRAERGVALIEVMIALLIFLVGVLGIVGLQAKAVQFSVQAEDRSRAALLADALVTELKARRATDVDSGVLKDWQARVDKELPEARGQAAIEGTLLTVTVEWRAPGTRPADGATSNRYQTKAILP